MDVSGRRDEWPDFETPLACLDLALSADPAGPADRQRYVFDGTGPCSPALAWGALAADEVVDGFGDRGEKHADLRLSMDDLSPE